MNVFMSELTTSGLVVGVEAEECNKIIRVQGVQVKEEMEEPKEAVVNKSEGSVCSELERHVCSDEGKQALKMSDDKGRKVSKGGILIRSLLGGSSLGSQTAGGRVQLEITDRGSRIVASDYGRMDPIMYLCCR
jgi:hypothetical protein